jgi:hypothetical protein
MVSRNSVAKSFGHATNRMTGRPLPTLSIADAAPQLGMICGVPSAPGICTPLPLGATLMIGWDLIKLVEYSNTVCNVGAA